jgi:hypothetical protein
MSCCVAHRRCLQETKDRPGHGRIRVYMRTRGARAGNGIGNGTDVLPTRWVFMHTLHLPRRAFFRNYGDVAVNAHGDLIAVVSQLDGCGARAAAAEPDAPVQRRLGRPPYVRQSAVEDRWALAARARAPARRERHAPSAGPGHVYLFNRPGGHIVYGNVEGGTGNANARGRGGRRAQPHSLARVRAQAWPS